MKLNENSRFPHPVLAPWTGDYVEGNFSVELMVEEVPESGKVSFDYKVSLTHPDLRHLVEEGVVAVGLIVSCLETYFSELVQFGLEPGRFQFQDGALIGRVTMRPLLWAREPVCASISHCHVEFGNGPFAVPTGAVLGLASELVISVGREKLAQIDSIFSLLESKQLEPDTFSLNLDADKIQILVASNAYSNVNALRGVGPGLPVILNGVYLPAVMEVLDSLRDGYGMYEGRRWLNVFKAKCDHLGIDIEAAELWKSAQRLLNSPFAEISKKAELFGG
jgi:hypothetical protein